LHTNLRFTIADLRLKNFSAENWKMVQPVVELGENPAEAKTPNWNQNNTQNANYDIGIAYQFDFGQQPN
jgi:hypothetical protein